MSKWMEIKNDFIDEMNADNGVATMFIDSYLTEDDNEEGIVIAKIKGIKTEDQNKIEVIYIDNVAKNDEYAQEVINEGIEIMKEYEF